MNYDNEIVVAVTYREGGTFRLIPNKEPIRRAGDLISLILNKERDYFVLLTENGFIWDPITNWRDPEEQFNHPESNKRIVRSLISAINHERIQIDKLRKLK